jgi:hypothetical protein
VIVHDVNATSAMSSVQLPGQPGAPGIGETGPVVFTANPTFPFLISHAGIGSVPVTVTGAGFWPGGCCLTLGFVQVAVGGLPAAFRLTRETIERQAVDP